MKLLSVSLALLEQNRSTIQVSVFRHFSLFPSGMLIYTLVALDLSCLPNVQKIYLVLLLPFSLELVHSSVEQCPQTEKYYEHGRNEIIISKNLKDFL